MGWGCKARRGKRGEIDRNKNGQFVNTTWISLSSKVNRECNDTVIFMPAQPAWNLRSMINGSNAIKEFNTLNKNN